MKTDVNGPTATVERRPVSTGERPCGCGEVCVCRDALTGPALERQLSELHDRGTDRLLRDVLGEGGARGRA